jgi:MFS family permease
VLATQLGRLGDMFGRVRMYEAGFAVFVLGSLLCALAWNAASLIGFRVLQGTGAALVAANSGAIISELYPPAERGRAYGFNALGFSLGSVLGVLLGGVIVTYVSWRWIFWINVPIGTGALLLALRVLRDRGEQIRRRLDPLGMITLGLGLFGVLRTFASVGMVFSFTTAILVAAQSIPRGTALAIFAGTARLHGQLAAVFTSGLHAAFYTLTGIMALAAVLSAIRGRPTGPRPTVAPAHPPHSDPPARTGTVRGTKTAATAAGLAGPKIKIKSGNQDQNQRW